MTIEQLKIELASGANLGSSFNFTGTAPNFNRDYIKDVETLRQITYDDYIYDIGHIVFCGDGNLYIFRGEQKDGYVGQFEKLNFLSDEKYSNLTKPFQYQGNVEDLENLTNVSEGFVYRIKTEGEDTFVIPSGSSVTEESVSGSTGDMIICVGKTDDDKPIWSVLQNNLNESGLIKKDTNSVYQEDEIPMYTNSDGDTITSSGIKKSDLVLLETDPSYGINDNTTLFPSSGGTGVEIPAVSRDGNLVDSKVTVSVLQALQKELKGEERTELPDNPIEGTLADIIKKYRENGYSLGSTFDNIEVKEEVPFIVAIQEISKINEKNVGFVVPLTIFRNNSENEEETYLFQSFVPEDKESIKVEATVRIDSITTTDTNETESEEETENEEIETQVEENQDILFHLDFEIDFYSIQYWYKGSDGSQILYVEYGCEEE